MAKIEIIIHPACIEIDLQDPGLSPVKRSNAEKALEAIREVIEGANHLVVVTATGGRRFSIARSQHFSCEWPCRFRRRRYFIWRFPDNYVLMW